jgi:phage protein D
MFTVVIEYTHPEDGLQEQDSWKVETLAEAVASIAAAQNLDCYVNPVGYVYDADGERVA